MCKFQFYLLTRSNAANCEFECTFVLCNCPLAVLFISLKMCTCIECLVILILLFHCYCTDCAYHQRKWLMESNAKPYRLIIHRNIEENLVIFGNKLEIMMWRALVVAIANEIDAQMMSLSIPSTHRNWRHETVQKWIEYSIAANKIVDTFANQVTTKRIISSAIIAH